MERGQTDHATGEKRGRATHVVHVDAGDHVGDAPLGLWSVVPLFLDDYRAVFGL